MMRPFVFHLQFSHEQKTSAPHNSYWNHLPDAPRPPHPSPYISPKNSTLTSAHGHPFKQADQIPQSLILRMIPSALTSHLRTHGITQFIVRTNIQLYPSVQTLQGQAALPVSSAITAKQMDGMNSTSQAMGPTIFYLENR